MGKDVFNYLFLIEFYGGAEIPHLVLHTKREWSLLKEIPLSVPSFSFSQGKRGSGMWCQRLVINVQ